MVVRGRHNRGRSMHTRRPLDGDAGSGLRFTREKNTGSSLPFPSVQLQAPGSFLLPVANQTNRPEKSALLVGPFWPFAPLQHLLAGRMDSIPADALALIAVHTIHRASLGLLHQSSAAILHQLVRQQYGLGESKPGDQSPPSPRWTCLSTASPPPRSAKGTSLSIFGVCSLHEIEIGRRSLEWLWPRRSRILSSTACVYSSAVVRGAANTICFKTGGWCLVISKLVLALM